MKLLDVPPFYLIARKQVVRYFLKIHSLRLQAYSTLSLSFMTLSADIYFPLPFPEGYLTARGNSHVSIFSF